MSGMLNFDGKINQNIKTRLSVKFICASIYHLHISSRNIENLQKEFLLDEILINFPSCKINDISWV